MIAAISRVHCLTALWLVVFVVVPLPAKATPGEEVVVVFNEREQGSEQIARHYASKRGVPEKQVLGLRMPVTEQVTRAEFVDEIQAPIARFLEEQQLWSLGPSLTPGKSDKPAEGRSRVVTWSKIRYLVLCRGVPLKIASDPEWVEHGVEEMRPEFRRNEAAVDSELACLPLLAASYRVAGPLQNPVYGVTNAALIHPTNVVLMVARLDAPTVKTAMALVDKALQAETNGFWGRAYFDLRTPSEPGMQQGENWIRAASEVCRALGFETVVDAQPATFERGFPMSQIAVYAGWYAADVNGPFLNDNVEFMPGALAYHLHSFSAASLRTPDHYWVAPLLEKGATISLGCVYEPYLGGTPDIGVLVARLYFLQFDYGEAAYAAQPVISWMTTVVGDPLFKPMLRPPEELHKELVMRQDPLRVWSQLRLVNLGLAKGSSKYQAVTYLEEIPATAQSAVLSEKLGDLYSELGKPASALRAWQAALDLDPSPQQRIRLQLRLGQKLTEAAQTREALSIYEQFLGENPNYAGAVDVYQKMVPLASDLGKTNQVARFQEELLKRAGNGPNH